MSINMSYIKDYSFMLPIFQFVKNKMFTEHNGISTIFFNL